MKESIRSWLNYAVMISIGLTVIIGLSAFSSSLLNFEKSNPKEHHLTLSNIVDSQAITLENEINTTSNIKINDDILEMGTIISYNPDTLTEVEKKVLIAELEKELQELKSINWDEHLKEIETSQQEIISEIPERIKDEQFRIQEELMRVDKELFRKKMDSILKDLDIETLSEELEKYRKELEVQLRKEGLTNKEIRIKFQESLAAINEIDFDEIIANIESSFEDIDMDFDFDFDFRLDTLIENLHLIIDNIDIEPIKRDINQSIEKIESQLRELKEKE